jgi:molecular chaperone IbpA
MRNIDFDPFWRSSIGFDRLFALIDETLESEDRYPPYNILRTGEETYRVSLAMAGFPPEQVSVTQHQNVLTISARPSMKSENAEYLFRGIAGRAFEKRFNLADYVEAEDASFENGLLQIDLVRRVPEAMKPRRIEIGLNKASGKAGDVKTIGHVQAA